MRIKINQKNNEIINQSNVNFLSLATVVNVLSLRFSCWLIRNSKSYSCSCYKSSSVLIGICFFLSFDPPKSRDQTPCFLVDELGSADVWGAGTINLVMLTGVSFFSSSNCCFCSLNLFLSAWS